MFQSRPQPIKSSKKTTFIEDPQSQNSWAMVRFILLLKSMNEESEHPSCPYFK